MSEDRPGAEGHADDRPELVDLHCHYVPEVDDGAESLEAALGYLDEELGRGVKRVVTTPHLQASRAGSGFRRTVEVRFEVLRKAAARELPELELSLAYETRLDGAPIDPADEGLWLGPARHVLVEYDLFRLPDDPFAPLLPLLKNGLTPVLAHPERYHGAARDEFWIDALRGSGVKLCLNVGSCLGTHGSGPARLARRLLSSGRADLVASDHHARPGRDDSIADLFERLVRVGHGEAARLLVAENPRVALEGGRMTAVPDVPADALDVVGGLQPAAGDER